LVLFLLAAANEYVGAVLDSGITGIFLLDLLDFDLLFQIEPVTVTIGLPTSFVNVCRAARSLYYE